MKTRSKKNKGGRLQKEIKAVLHKYYTEFEDGDIKVAIMGESGRDIHLSPLAEKTIPFDIEAKNQERTNIWEFLKQTEKNTGKGRIPLLIFSRNYSKTYAVLEFETLIKLLTNQKTTLNE